MAASEPDVRTPALPAFEEMARSLHASYLDRWARHDQAELSRPAALPPGGAEDAKEETRAAAGAA